MTHETHNPIVYRIIYYTRKVREVGQWPISDRRRRRVKRLLAYKEAMHKRIGRHSA